MCLSNQKSRRRHVSKKRKKKGSTLRRKSRLNCRRSSSLSSLKKMKYRSSDECVICFNALGDDRCTLYNCKSKKHPLHALCAQTWKNGGGENNRRCPVCRSEERREPPLHAIAPSSYEELLETITSLPRSIHKVYVGLEFPPNMYCDYLFIDLRYIDTFEKQKTVVDALVALVLSNSMIRTIQGDDIDLIVPVQQCDIMFRFVRGKSSFVRMFELLHVQKRLVPNELKSIFLECSSDSPSMSTWEWQAFSTCVQTHSESLEELKILNRLPDASSSYQMSSFMSTSMRNLNKLNLQNVDFDGMRLSHLSNLEALLLDQYRYTNESSLSLLNDLSSLPSLREICIEDWTGFEGRGIIVMRPILAALESVSSKLSMLDIRESPSLFDVDTTKELFQVLRLRPSVSVMLFDNNIERTFEQWKGRNSSRVNSWIIRN